MFQLWALFVCLFTVVTAESGIDAWLRYAPLPSSYRKQWSAPANIVALNSTTTSPVYTAGQELHAGIEGIFGASVPICHGKRSGSAIVVGTIDEYESVYGALENAPELEADGFWLSTTGKQVQILGQNERGALYGAFEYLSMLAQGNFTKVAYATSPDAPIRWVNQWDNMDGTIERGYGGGSIFFANNSIVDDLTRASQYARILSSIRINAVVVNNVNANYTTIEERNIKGLGRIADVFRPYGVQLALSLNFASPMNLSSLPTYDPLDPDVIQWWHDKTDEIYRSVPDFAGYLVKANSEGQPGPIVYNRTLAEGANLFARTLQPYGGVVMFRAFVYDQLNETFWKEDRANAAVDYFKPLDGDFDDNVVVQCKYGAIDFQVREPASPLFANLRHTSAAIELQITQEYLGQQCHLVYLPPLWKTILDFDLRISHEPSLVSDVVSGQRFGRKLGGYAGVVNVGTNTTWLGSIPALSNLYAYGALAWNPKQDPEMILRSWIKITFGFDPEVMSVLTDISMDSWPAYEKYSGNLGIQTLTDILHTHYGPNPASQDNNGWGQWTRADHDSVGMDRTCWNGTCNAGQYPDEISQIYENIETTPDDLLLWFHHVPWTHILDSGVSVIQHFYNAHYTGANMAQRFRKQMASLTGKIDSERFDQMLFRQTYQAGHSIVWRDAIAEYYWNMTGIEDKKGRVGNHPYRIKATNMELDGYEPYVVNPFEMASPPDYTAVVTATNDTTGTASTTITFDTGRYDLAVNYYDLYGGKSSWTLYLDDNVVGQWMGDAEDHLGHTASIYLDGHSAIRKTFADVKVKKGSVLKIVGEPDGVEPAPLDYVSVLPKGVVD